MANTTDSRGRWRLFNMMQAIGNELEDATGAFSFNRKLIQVLDLCMAPGGFTSSSYHRICCGLLIPLSPCINSGEKYEYCIIPLKENSYDLQI
jgi:hypothetical protein